MIRLAQAYRGFCMFFFGFLICVSPIKASEVPTATISLLSNSQSIQKGHELLLGLQFKLPENWETFWRTPGDVGYGVRFSWDGSQNLEHADVLWPSPARVKSNDFIANVYHKEVTFPVKITPKDVTKPLILHLKLDYLLCNPSACVPQEKQLSMVFQPGNATLTPEAAQIDKAMASIPKAGNSADLAMQHFIVSQKNDEIAELKIDVSSAKGFKEPLLFIEGSQNLQFSVPKFTKINNTHGFFTSEVKIKDSTEPRKLLAALLNKPIQFTLVNNKDAISIPQALASNDSSIITPPPAKAVNEEYVIGLILLFAFLGGLILNLMPCVFPILSIKILTLRSVKNKRMQGLFYTLGVLVSFLTIALIILTLQSLGDKVGWGFQMQSPAFLIILIFLFTLISLNLFGFYEIPFSLNTNLKWQKTHELLYAFGTGVMACLVTTPCSAPFMATAVGVAVSTGSWVAILIFLSLGFGFALPYLLLCTLPNSMVILPKSGVWMEKFKQFLGFPMLLSVIWLLWVAGFQMSHDSVMMLLLSLFFLILIFWLLRNTKRGTLRQVSIFVSIILMLYPLHWIQQELKHKPQQITSYEYSPEKLESLIKGHHKVFVYATAAWCITCKMNERVALNTSDVQNFFKKENIVLMKADWTIQNDIILRYLQDFNRAGVPLYVYYPESGNPVVLPQMLTPATIIKHIQKAP